MKGKHIYLVITGNGPAGQEGVKYISFDREKAIVIAK
jgi:hypothetical protein